MKHPGKWAGYWIRDPLWGAIDHLTYAGLRCLSLQRASGLGARIGSLARHRFREADQNALMNMKALRPQCTDDQIEALVAQMWGNIGRTLTEMAVLDRFDFARDTNVINLESFDGIDRSRPVIFIYPHLGNWELLARYAVNRGYRLHVIYEPVPNRFQRRLLETARRRSGYELIAPDYQGTRRIHASMSDAESIGIAMDEFKHSRVCAPWFGAPPRKRTNIHTAVRLARKYGATIVCGYCLRRDSVSFELVCGEPIDLQSGQYGDRRDEEIVAGINSICRQWVLASPEQWYMLHRARLTF